MAGIMALSPSGELSNVVYTLKFLNALRTRSSAIFLACFVISFSVNAVPHAAHGRPYMSSRVLGSEVVLNSPEPQEGQVNGMFIAASMPV